MKPIVESLKDMLTGLWPWFYGLGVFIVSILTMILIKRTALRRIHAIAEKSGFEGRDVVAKALNVPLTILILGTGLYFAQLVTPHAPRWEHFVIIVFRCSIVLSVILFLDQILYHVLRNFGARMEFLPISQGLFQGLLRGALIGLGLLVFADTIGISISPILASLGIGSLAVALGLQDTLTNFFAGIYITIDKPLRVGDFVKLESGGEGYVTEIGWRSTRIRMLPNNTIIIPNQKLTSSIITNYYMPSKDLGVPVDVAIHSDNDLKKVELATIDVAKHIIKTVTGTVPEFEPCVRFHTFSQATIGFTAVLRAKEFTDQFLIKHEFIKALHERFKKEGVSLIGPLPRTALELSKEAAEILSKR